MSQKILKISTDPQGSEAVSGPLKIYSPADIVFISDAKKYYEETKEKCQKMLADTQKKCKDTEEEHYKNILAKVHEENQKIWEESTQKCDEFLAKTEKEIQDLMKGMVHKLYADMSLTEKMFALLNQEISKIQSRVKLITVYANPNVIHVLRDQVLGEHQGIPAILEFQVREGLIDEECIIETDYGITRLNVERFMGSLLG